MTCAWGSWRHVVGARPDGVLERRSGIRRARRPQARRTAIAPSAPGRRPTAFAPRCHPGAAAPCLSWGPSVSVRAHRGREACRLDGTRARPRGTPVLGRRRATPRRTLVVQRPASRHGGRHWCRDGGAQASRGAQPRLRCGPGDGRCERRQAVGERLLTSGVMRGPAPGARRWPDLLAHLDRRPPAPPSPATWGAAVSTPGSHRRARGLQPGRQPLAEPGAGRDQAPSLGHQRWPGACRGMVWPPRLEMLPLLAAPREPSGGLARRSCGPAGRARWPVLGAWGRGERVEPQTVIRQARSEAWTTRRLPTDRELPAGTAGAPGGGPGGQRCWGVLEDDSCWLAGRRRNQTASRRGV
jgi:hypothetical protein